MIDKFKSRIKSTSTNLTQQKIIIRRSKIVLYTAITANKNDLQNINIKGCECICYTDSINKLNGRGWKINHIESRQRPALQAKYFKLNPHRLFDADYSLWIDGSITPKFDHVDAIIDKIIGYDAVFHKHPLRNCWHKEALTCLICGFDTREKIMKLVNRYEGVIEHDSGLVACGVILREHNRRTKLLNTIWWNEIISGSIRDQISIMYAINKSGARYNHFDGNIYNSQFFMVNKHNH